jgi:hypothetical protein
MEKNRDNPNNALPQDYLQSCYEELVIAMLELTMKDLTIPDSEIEESLYDSIKVRGQKEEKKYYKHSAYMFVRSEWFEDLCWYVGVNPDPIRQYAIERYNESKKK